MIEEEEVLDRVGCMFVQAESYQKLPVCTNRILSKMRLVERRIAFYPRIVLDKAECLYVSVGPIKDGVLINCESTLKEYTAWISNCLERDCYGQERKDMIVTKRPIQNPVSR